MGAGAALPGFVKERTHSLWLAWREAGLREAGKRTNFLSEPLSQNKLPKKSQEKCQPQYHLHRWFLPWSSQCQGRELGPFDLSLVEETV